MQRASFYLNQPQICTVNYLEFALTIPCFVEMQVAYTDWCYFVQNVIAKNMLNQYCLEVFNTNSV